MKTVKLNSGAEMPMLGLGTWQSSADELKTTLKWAVDIGYRHVDCAFLYANEKAVGEGLKAVFKKGKVNREDIFVTSKLWCTQMNPELVEKSLRDALADLQLSYLDLYLMHWPIALKEGDGLLPTENGKLVFSDVDYLDTWKEMEKLVDAGLVKTIGVSNFNSEQIQRILDNSRIKPAVNQVEVHPALSQQRMIDFCKCKGIIVTAYSPLGSPGRPDWTTKSTDPNALKDPKVLAIANKYKRTPAQVLLRLQVQRGVVVIPKSSNKKRLTENFKISDFELTDGEIASLCSLDTGTRVINIGGLEGAKHYPFKIPF